MKCLIYIRFCRKMTHIESYFTQSQQMRSVAKKKADPNSFYDEKINATNSVKRMEKGINID